MIDIEKTKSEIIELLRPLGVEKVVLFGSYAYGKPHEDSDIDLYVVTSDDFMPKSYQEKSAVYMKVARKLLELEKQIPIDLIVHTKKMHEKFVALGSMFSRELMVEGKRLV